MKAPISKLRQVIEALQEIIDAADDRGVTKVNVSCNTYGLNEFVSLGSYGFLDVNADIDDLIDEPEFDDDME